MNEYPTYPMHVSVVVMSAEQLQQVYAVLAGDSRRVPYVPNTGDRPETVPAGNAVAAKPGTYLASAGPETSAPAEQESAGNGPTATSTASPSDAELDAHGHPWSEELHASTKTKTKEGLWRMKPGATRPEPMPGFPIEEASQANETADTATEQAGSSPTPEPDSAPASQDGSPADGEEEDEFAAFRAAAAKVEEVAETAKASVPARKWTDADLGALCNQAAVKMGDPSPIKEIIAEYVPEGEVAHSRNIPEDKRDDFAKAIEAKAGIEFAG